MTQEVYTDLEATPEKEPTFGQILVGYTFNPSADDKVAKAKALCAELADLVYESYIGSKESSVLKDKIMDHTIGEILNAQMNAVKLITFNMGK